MAKVKVGVVGFSDKGDWVESYSGVNKAGEQYKGYRINDLVHTNSGIYKSKVNDNLVNPDDDVNHDSWMVWLDKTPVNDSLSKVNALVDAFGSTNPFCGFARVSGDSDPKPSDEFTYGSRSLIREIGSHMKMGTFKRVDNECVLQHECTKGRITLASNGEDVAVDGTEGDLLFYTDIPLYLLKANEAVETNEMSCMGVGVVPCYWKDHTAKRIEPFAFSPFYTTNCKLDGDDRSQAHCVIGDKAIGSYSAVNGFFKEVFKASGAGYPSLSVSSLNSIHQAQNKNADQNTNRPYMGGYYELYELWIAMMYAECGTLNTTALNVMGVGCTMQEPVNDSTWNDETISANSGVKFVDSKGSASGYAGFMSQSLKKGADGTAKYNLEGISGGNYYSFTKNGEALSVLDGITKANLQSKIGVNSNVFYFNGDGDIEYSSDGSVNLTTGAGMTANKRYYVVRNVPNCQGIAEGVLTAVVNCYVKLNIADGIYKDTTDMTGGFAIFKFSHAIYRGMSVPMDGLFKQLCGAHYLSGKKDGAYYDKFYYASKIEDVQPLTDDTIYGTAGTKFNILKGLENVLAVPGVGGWVSKSNYNSSLFCFSELKGNSHTHEVCFTWNDHHMYGVADNPADGYEGVKALAVGCAANGGVASARTANCDHASSNSSINYAGAFAVPQLKLKQ